MSIVFFKIVSSRLFFCLVVAPHLPKRGVIWAPRCNAWSLDKTSDVCVYEGGRGLNIFCITLYYYILPHITLLYLVMLKNYVNMVSYSKFRICYMVYIFLSLYLMALEGGHLKMFSFFLLGWSYLCSFNHQN